MRRIFPTDPKIVWSDNVMQILAEYIQSERNRYNPKSPWHGMIGNQKFKVLSSGFISLINDYCSTGKINDVIQICKSKSERRPTWVVTKTGLNVWNNLNEDEQGRAAA